MSPLDSREPVDLAITGRVKGCLLEAPEQGGEMIYRVVGGGADKHWSAGECGPPPGSSRQPLLESQGC